MKTVTHSNSHRTLMQFFFPRYLSLIPFHFRALVTLFFAGEGDFLAFVATVAFLAPPRVFLGVAALAGLAFFAGDFLALQERKM